ncbi:unnamed protein product [Callosobruchus maculatus]|uniref:C-type lectin domain-containing protein n=1 Tax=Callosobruchus maculatus TaxID=64391 RepID=A0A653C8H6_CALMS|nr:unnamed protein product [Callosobruchus maculatus]
MRVTCAVVVTALSCIIFKFDSAQAQTRPVSNRPGRFLSLPNPQKCANRPKQFFFRGHNYFFSGHVPELAGRKVDWLDGRNICREYCMDLVSMETQEENNMIFRLIQQSSII